MVRLRAKWSEETRLGGGGVNSDIQILPFHIACEVLVAGNIVEH
jgi:hypothetical protein